LEKSVQVPVYQHLQASAVPKPSTPAVNLPVKKRRSVKLVRLLLKHNGNTPQRQAFTAESLAIKPVGFDLNP
jgi:hypothetical protein